MATRTTICFVDTLCFGQEYLLGFRTCFVGNILIRKSLCGGFRKWLCDCWCSEPWQFCEDPCSLNFWECFRTVWSNCGHYSMCRWNLSEVIDKNQIVIRIFISTLKNNILLKSKVPFSFFFPATQKRFIFINERISLISLLHFL